MLELGSIFAEKYRLLKLQAKGGTANVYRAFDDEQHLQVALKIFESSNISPEILDEMWFRESQALDRLSHPLIVKILSAGRDELTGLRFIAVEWLDGEAFEARLDSSGPLTWTQFFQSYGQQILEALSYAFKLNVIHRDLSTGNIFVLPSGGIKIIDFGQAKLDESIIGKTVRGWKTPPFCPPEDDSGRYSDTRDTFSFCAIVVRALRGKLIRNHEELYEAAKLIDIPDHLREVIDFGLSRDPEKRPSNIIELASLISGTNDKKEIDSEYIIAIRCIPNVLDKLQQSLGINSDDILETLIDELNDTLSVSVLDDANESSSTSIAIETPSFRLVTDVDSESKSHFVIVWAVKKRFSIDRLYATDRWMPTVTFLANSPKTQLAIHEAQLDIERFYSDFEDFLGAVKGPRALGDDIFDEWGRQLQALRHVERTRDAPLRYEDAEISGRRLTVTVLNSEDAEEDQVRTISHNGRWVFNGSIESLVGKTCVLYSNWSSVQKDVIPTKGTLEMDWYQARIALDRQSEALDRFATGSIPNQGVRSYITGSVNAGSEESFKSINKYFDSKLDDEKKLIVSKFLATPDLLLIHGPPGTGKTTLIVELVRQQLAEDASAKILLVSQTHVAIDNVLEKLDKGDPELLPVRIGSGLKLLGNRVSHCSVEERGRQLQSKVDAATESFLRARAKEQNIDFDEINLGLRAFEVLGLKRSVTNLEDALGKLMQELDDLNASFTDSKNTITREETESKAKVRVLEQDADRFEFELDSLRDQLKVAVAR